MAVDYGLRSLELAEFNLSGAPPETLLNPIVAMGSPQASIPVRRQSLRRPAALSG